ncbi:MAG: SagB/ThcOx family dehydrogenase [Planctomycetota bacterium]
MKVELPAARLDGEISVEKAIAQRRSQRRFAGEVLPLAQVGQLLWCAQGLTGSRACRRAAPSAGATYPLEVLVAVGRGTVEALEAGAYRYLPAEHALELAFAGDVRSQVATAALGQDFLASAPADILIAADYTRTADRYGNRAERYVHMEAGHVCQNIHLQAEALGLASVAVGAFRDEAVAEVFRLPSSLAPLYLVPVGQKG